MPSCQGQWTTRNLTDSLLIARNSYVKSDASTCGESEKPLFRTIATFPNLKPNARRPVCRRRLALYPWPVR
eukprot:scaffold290422_cov27-Prasinocladus_malaysianus.AAC.1